MTRATRSRMILFALCAALLVLTATTACSSRKVSNVDPREEEYLSGEWNDSDARAVSDQMVPECLAGGWLREFTQQNPGARPRVVVGEIINKSREHIATDVFTNELARVLINSGDVRFVSDPDIRKRLIEETRWQAGHASGGGVAPAVERGVAGADFMLQGDISTIVDQAKKKTIVYYQVDLKLEDLRTWETVWIGSTKRKHIIEGGSYRF